MKSLDFSRKSFSGELALADLRVGDVITLTRWHIVNGEKIEHPYFKVNFKTREATKELQQFVVTGHNEDGSVCLKIR